MEGGPAPFPALFRGRFFAARRAALNLAHASGPRSGAPGGPGALLSARAPPPRRTVRLAAPSARIRAALNLAHASGPRSGTPGAPGALLSARAPGLPSSPLSSARTSP